MPSWIFTGNPSGTRICNIYSPSLTSPDGVMYVPIGAQNVILYCICKIESIAVGPTRWFFNGQLITATQANGNNTYYRNNVPSPVIIPYFDSSHVGIYGCAGGSSSTMPSVNIELGMGILAYFYYQ